MILSEAEIADLLGVTAEELANGAIWLLPGGSGVSVRVQISRDREDGAIAAAVTETLGEDVSNVAWLSAVPSDSGFAVTGRDETGEAGDPDDPRAAAAAVRRQIELIRRSRSGRKAG